MSPSGRSKTFLKQCYTTMKQLAQRYIFYRVTRSRNFRKNNDIIMTIIVSKLTGHMLCSIVCNQ